MIVQLTEKEIGALVALGADFGETSGVRSALTRAIAFASGVSPEELNPSELAPGAHRSPTYPVLARLTPFPTFVVEKLRSAVESAAVGTLTPNQAQFVHNWFGCVVKTFEGASRSREDGGR